MMLTHSVGVSSPACLLSVLTYNSVCFPSLQVVMNNQRKIIWPGGETEKPQGFQMSTRLKVGCFRFFAAMWQSCPHHYSVGLSWCAHVRQCTNNSLAQGSKGSNDICAIPSYLSHICQGLLHFDLVRNSAVNLCLSMCIRVIAGKIQLFLWHEQLCVSSVVDSDDTSGAVRVREANTPRWNVQGGNDIKWSLN